MPPSAGPRARARLNPALLSDTASGSCSRGTSSGMIACHAGLFIAVPTLSRNVSISSTHGERMLRNVSRLSNATAPSIHACQKSSRRRRSKMSAVAPASRPSSTTGRLAAVCISAISSGDGVSTVISQVPAVSCIQPPRFEMVDATQSLRNSGARSGSNPVGGFSGCGFAAGTVGKGMAEALEPASTGTSTMIPSNHVFSS